MEATEDLDKYLYGEDFKATTPAANSTSVPAEEDEYEDEEDFEIVLDSSKATEINKRSLTSVSIAQDKSAASEAGKDSSSSAAGNASAAPVAHFDPFAPANLAGIMLFDHDLDSIEDKPWRKPGADLTDYFNYGFNESTWRAYCIKQRALRDEFGAQKKISVVGDRERSERERERERSDRERKEDYRHEPRHEPIRDYRSERNDSRNDPRNDYNRIDRTDRNDPRGQYDRHYDSSRRPPPPPPSRSSRSPSASPPPPPSTRRVIRQPNADYSPSKRRRD